MDKLCLLFFAALVNISAAQLKCDTPPVWEARLFESNPKFDRLAKISYDAENMRTRIIEEVFIESDQEKDYYDELFLHQEKMGYKLNLKTKECEKFTLNEPFREVGVPLGARLEGELEIGTAAFPGAGVRVQVYEAETPRGRYAGEWIPVDHLCVPVSDTFISQRDRSISHWSFFDLTLGIKDPNVFDIPPDCM